MTLTIPDVENWQPERLSAAGGLAERISQGLDTAVGKGADDTKALADAKKWSGTAGDAANARMQTEKTRASAVSAALLELKTALTTQVQNLADAKAKVLSLRDDALNQTPPFDVAPDGTVGAKTRIDYLRAHADKADIDGLVFQEALQAASRTWELTNALKTAEDVAAQARTQVEGAAGKLEAAFAGLGEPSANVPTAPTTPAATAPAATSGAPVAAPSSDRPSRLMSGHNDSGSSYGTSSGTPYQGGPSSSAPTGPLPSGDVARWIAEAKQKLIAMGYDPATIDERAIALIIQHESAGNPYAENRWDSNWVAGHPSKGLMQTIDSTFNAYKAPGHDDIWNPVDNIIAGVRYSIDRYGSLGNVPGVAAVNSGGAYQGY
ncbi:transglycosylase SLT domain-containing protein [Streptomyces gardneri]|uniref:transglycosylase SLT domain-containing protein n=1 Tax=Nocardia TaxID=1817 RepID=UPI00135AC9A1|nr:MULTISPECIES: transglycosylase SLT domain-containing protein [Nocardia]MBF6169126.1 transglycosylase SLT domain-containing protein [Streptomyces gardneri]UAK33372.1 transglycosylase SLT domain-containing protein [Nocardia asteroides]